MTIFSGIITALITPSENDKINFTSLEKLIENQIDAGISSIVVGGSTGEGISLSEKEYYELIEKSVRISSGRINIIAGLTSTATIRCIDKVKSLCALKVNGLMCTIPHYVKPEQSGIIQHFQAISHNTSVPVMMYSHPSRTGSSLEDSTLLEIAKMQNIEAIKDASSDIEKPLRIRPEIKPNFSFLSGDDAAILAYSANGGLGCVSVISNVMPKVMQQIDHYSQNLDFYSARGLMQRILPIISAVGSESNPIGIKYLAYKLGLSPDEIRLPLTWASAKTQKIIDEIIPLLKELEK